jgi:cysteine sulfinate desulfinase/cysteine desulfurase-like protein
MLAAMRRRVPASVRDSHPSFVVHHPDVNGLPHHTVIADADGIVLQVICHHLDIDIYARVGSAQLEACSSLLLCSEERPTRGLCS